MHIGPSALAMTISKLCSVLSMPSRVTIFSPSSALLTMTFPPLILSASNVWSGWPTSKRTKLEMSTILLIGFSPMENSFFWSHSGEGPTFTFLIVIPSYSGAPSVSFTSTGIAPSPLPSSNEETSGYENLQGMPLSCMYAYKSLATPIWDAASTLFAVISYSMTASDFRWRYSLAVVPGTASAGSTLIPSWLFPIPSSSSAQIIPNDSTPRILDFLILKSPGSTAPSLANRTFCPAATFGAPQTTVRSSPVPSFTLVI